MNKKIHYKLIAQELKLSVSEVYAFQQSYLKTLIIDWEKYCTFCDTWKPNNLDYFTSWWYTKQDWTKNLKRKCKVCRNRMRKNDTIMNNDRAKKCRIYSNNKAQKQRAEWKRNYKLISEMTEEELKTTRQKRKLNSRNKRVKAKKKIF